MDKKIAIVGGGPGGLMLARLLQLKGVDVKVYERDVNRHARVQGAIVDLHFDSGLRVMKAAGLMDAFKANYMPGADAYRLLDQHANILMEERQGMANFEDERFRPEIDRGVLRNMLLDALAPDTVVWDSQFVRMELVQDEWHLTFENGTTAVADIVIGADGYRSKIRPYVTSGPEYYSGATIIQGDVEDPEKDCPEMYALLNKANLIAMGTGKTIAAQPSGEKGMTFYTASLYPEGWIQNSGIDFNNKEEVAAYLMSYYADWHPVFYSMMKASGRFIPRPLNYVPLDQSWEAAANITLIGDAAHLMPPSGEGVNTAMLDALDVCNCLTSDAYDNLRDAIAAYEDMMRARAAELGKEAIAGIKGFASPDEESINELKKVFKASN